jgi:hypothetical protein
LIKNSPVLNAQRQTATGLLFVLCPFSIKFVSFFLSSIIIVSGQVIHILEEWEEVFKWMKTAFNLDTPNPGIASDISFAFECLWHSN